MEDIKDIIGTIVRGCAQGGVVVSEVLAAFVARTVRMKLFLFFCDDCFDRLWNQIQQPLL
jgi:hypothetical protein